MEFKASLIFRYRKFEVMSLQIVNRELNSPHMTDKRITHGCQKEHFNCSEVQRNPEQR